MSSSSYSVASQYHNRELRQAVRQAKSSIVGIVKAIVQKLGALRVMMSGFNAPNSNLRLLLTGADTRDKVHPDELRR